MSRLCRPDGWPFNPRDPLSLPNRIASRVVRSSLEPIDAGESNSDVFRVELATGGAAFLKVSGSGYVRAEIQRERMVLEWLKPFVCVPSPIDVCEEDGRVFFLMTSIGERNLAEAGPHLGKDECIAMSARLLRAIHSIPIDSCPFDRKVNVVLQLAKQNIEAGLVDVSDFDSERVGQSALDVYERLLVRVPPIEDLVFTHGDYCFQNIVVSGDKAAGVVDLGRAGIADRHQDLALIFRSLDLELDGPEATLFLREYGLIDTFALQKLEFYRALDEFF